jgi:hypothetical protein
MQDNINNIIIEIYRISIIKIIILLFYFINYLNLYRNKLGFSKQFILLTFLNSLIILKAF